MRVRLSFEEGILGPSRKLWIDYADQTTVLDFIKYVKNTFDIKYPLEIWLDGFFVHMDLEFTQAFKQAEILFVKIKDDFVKVQPDISVKALKNKDEKMKGKNLKKELKKNPKAAEFQGTKYKFDEKGNIKEVIQIRPELNVPTPAEEYEMKRAEWKIKPIPKRKPFKTYESKAPAMLEDKRYVLPHQLNAGDKISFSTLDSNFIKVMYI